MTRLNYPPARVADIADDFFGTRVADPYRWLEDADSAETREWMEAENRLTAAYLDQAAERPAIERLLNRLWNYVRYGVPSREGPYYIYGRNDGLQNHGILYRATTLAGEGDVLLDPNQFSADGTVALSGTAFTDDGRHVAYGVSASGSDWIDWRVRDVAAATDLPDVVHWSKFSVAAWKKDGSGFYYSRYAAPREGEEYQAINKHQKVYFHALGTSQDEDVLVYERPDQPDWGFSAQVTDDGRFLLVYQSEGTEPRNRVFVADLSDPSPAVAPFLDAFDAEYDVVGNDGDRFYVRTDKDAPRGQLVAIDRHAPSRDKWHVLIPEAPGRDVIASIDMAANRFVAVWLTDAHHRLKVYDIQGRFERDIELPGLGTIPGFNGRREQSEGFYAFTSFTYPTTIFRYDFETGTSEVLKQPAVPFDASNYETRQEFYTSKDGTRIPMFITHRRGLARDGGNPTYLYGYGGFNISLTPGFSPADAAWLELGGVHAVANLRGGGEYGKAWHDAGRLAHKQNAFDDFIAAAEHLVAAGYTSPKTLAIAGGSNGGLLVGACLTQRPDLFGAAVASVGVFDMVRFHKFTIGWAWTSDYGSADTKDGFETLIRYSPLHNIRPGTHYPATLVLTSDHDDRVVPLHSFKFAAALQAAQGGDAPILIRIETKAGHGAGKPTSKIIEEQTDKLAFLVRVLNMAVGSAG
ncbi:MAG: prolyl oligopeptidase family serine peptidase [Bacteroidales bacterium]